MRCKILGSNSAGNCYLFYNNDECLILELGVKFSLVKQALNFNLSKVVYAVCTHEHGDHSKAVKDALLAGIRVVMSKGTQEALNLKSHRIVNIAHGQKFKAGNFEVMAFDVKHDCAEPLGFLIRHPEIGTTVFITDSYYVPYVFPGLTNIMVEANFSREIINERAAVGSIHDFLKDRTLSSHMSIETCKDFLRANDLSKVNNILLLHLSDSNSNAEQFEREVKELTAKTVNVACKGMDIPFGVTPF
jgi:phosphoribosyl 1,2-cyclic phosphodiesterase